MNLSKYGVHLKPTPGLCCGRGRIAHHPVSDRTVEYSFDKPDGTESDKERMSWFEVYASEVELLRGLHEDVMPLHKDDLQAHFVLLGGIIMRLDRF